jgi:tetratricopeptide (TPR) repeat protein
VSNYVFGSRLSYRDYLQVKSFEDSFRSEISKHTRSIIASNEQLQQEHISVSKSLGTAISEGFEQLSFDVRGLTEGVSELTAAFHWGFSELLIAVGRVNDTLAQLVRIAKTPAQTWAYEQFEIARDAFRQELYPESLEYLDRAINGYVGNTGYKLEYRFHYLLGTIRLGSSRNTSPEILNLTDAENAFLNAAKYARRDAPKEAGRAFLAAGWTAYCQGKIDVATHDTEEALSLSPALAEAHFQLAKLRMHVGEPDHALLPLRRAIELDRGYSIKAAADGDFKPHEVKVQALLNTLRHEAREKAKTVLLATQRRTGDIEKQGVQEFSLTKYAEITSARRALDEASASARVDTYFGYLDALSLCGQATQSVQQAVTQFVARARAEVKQRITDLDSRIVTARTRQMGVGWFTLMLGGILVFFILGCKECGRVYEANTRQEQIRKNAFDRMSAELRAKGYNPNQLSIDQARRLGYRKEDLPPENIGRTALDAWFSYVLFGVLLSVGIAFIGDKSRKSSAIGALESEKERLQHIDSDIQGIQ